MLRVLIGITVMTSAASSAPCKDSATCTAECKAGDPAACVLAANDTFVPLQADFKPDNGSWDTCTEGGPYLCRRQGAQVWAGVGTKRRLAIATAIWRTACSEDHDTTSCLAWAKAVEHDGKLDAARIEYHRLCAQQSEDLGCYAAGALWTRVTDVVDGVKFSVELPAAMETIATWGHGTWHVAWSDSLRSPDVTISGRSLSCSVALPPAKRAGDATRDKYVRWLPPGWAERICKSVRAER